MTDIQEGGLRFSFANHCEAAKYDNWDFYRQQFQSVAGGSRAVDILCVAQDVSWLIEIKDYRQHQRSKPSNLGDEVATKVRDTLAGLTAASANAIDKSEQGLAERALTKRKWRVALHLEQQSRHLQVVSPANVLKKLRMTLKAIDTQPIVVSLRKPNSDTPWTVQ